MITFVEYLRRFDRKERFYLIGWALGRPTFQLDDGFRKSLGSKLGLGIPPVAFVAMDYHLNWIYAAAYLSSPGMQAADVYENREIVDPTNKLARRMVQGN